METDKLMGIIWEMEVPIVFTSAGNPATWTSHLKDRGITVVHVVSSVKFALKAQQAGVERLGDREPDDIAGAESDQAQYRQLLAFAIDVGPQVGTHRQREAEQADDGDRPVDGGKIPVHVLYAFDVGCMGMHIHPEVDEGVVSLDRHDLPLDFVTDFGRLFDGPLVSLFEFTEESCKIFFICHDWSFVVEFCGF